MNESVHALATLREGKGIATVNADATLLQIKRVQEPSEAIVVWPKKVKHRRLQMKRVYTCMYK